jgi:hypothetical protein
MTAEHQPAEKKRKATPVPTPTTPLSSAEGIQQYNPLTISILQRAIGNHAVQRLLAQRRLQPTQPIVQTASKGRIQRNVGFEFEVGAYEVEKMAAPMTAQEAAGASVIPLAGADGGDLEKADVLAQNTGFELQIDEGANNFHLEFVTTGAGFAETSDGRKALKVALQGMESLGNRIVADAKTGGPKKVNQGATARAIPTAALPGGVGTNPETIILSHGFAMTAEPQTTAGIRLDQLPALMENMASPAGESAKKKQKRSAQRGVLAGKSAKPDTDAMRDAAPAARTAITNFKQQMVVAGTPVPAGFGSGNLVGLMALIYTYLKRATMIVGTYPKSLFPLLGISDFGSMFAMLPQADKTPFTTTPQHFVDINLDAAGMTGTGAVAFFAGGFRHPMTNMSLIDSQNAGTILTAITRAGWLRNIPRGTDMLTQGVAHVDALESMGKFNRGEQVGQTHLLSSNTTTTAPILELRRMAGRVGINNWKDMALDIYDFIVKLNDKDTTEFEKDRYDAAAPK